MKSKNELKEIDIKNRACYYLNDIIIGAKIKFGKNQNLYENISVYNIIKHQQAQNHCVLGSISFFYGCCLIKFEISLNI